MASDIIQEIKKAEKEAGERIARAEESARSILQECRAVAAAKAREVEDGAADKAEMIRYEAEKKADEYAKRAIAEHEKQCEKLKEAAVRKKDMAVAACMEFLFQ